jgi:hypothetical protein
LKIATGEKARATLQESIRVRDAKQGLKLPTDSELSRIFFGSEGRPGINVPVLGNGPNLDGLLEKTVLDSDAMTRNQALAEVNEYIGNSWQRKSEVIGKYLGLCHRKISNAESKYLSKSAKETARAEAALLEYSGPDFLMRLKGGMADTFYRALAYVYLTNQGNELGPIALRILKRTNKSFAFQVLKNLLPLLPDSPETKDATRLIANALATFSGREARDYQASVFRGAFEKDNLDLFEYVARDALVGCANDGGDPVAERALMEGMTSKSKRVRDISARGLWAVKSKDAAEVRDIYVFAEAKGEDSAAAVLEWLRKNAGSQSGTMTESSKKCIGTLLPDGAGSV